LVFEMTRLLLSLFFSAAIGTPAQSTDVVIYGGTPGGLAAAAAVVAEGLSVTVVEPTGHIGGMVTGGIAITDTGTPHLVGGIAGRFFDEVAAAEAKLHPSPAPTVLLLRGSALPWREPRKWDLEPKVARQVFERWLRDGGYRLLLRKRVASVTRRDGQIASVKLTDGAVLTAKVFIDASYEGDLMARAGVGYTYGREASHEFGEKLAGVRHPHFKQNYTAEEYRTPTIAYMHNGQFGADLSGRDSRGKRLWGVDPAPKLPVGAADRKVQAYCFRLIATQRPEIKLPWPKPDRYDARRYELLLRYVLAHPGIVFSRVVHLGAIPGGKFDLNASGPFSIDYIGGNNGYPDAGYPTRDRMWHDHEDYEKGFLWFLANDPRVPADLRADAASWGLASDEFTDNANWPTQLYIREGRRMQGAYVTSERDILTDKKKNDSVGMGSFVLDSHWVQRFENEQGFVRVEGHLDESVNLSANPYEIPYRSLTPKRAECRNLLVPVCLSATHVAVCTIRMEPVYMVLGHSAGVAAAMAIRAGKAVQDIEMEPYLERLRNQKQVLHWERKK
jgi:hypothetical protein